MENSIREGPPPQVLHELALDQERFDEDLHHHDWWELTRIYEGAGVMVVGAYIRPYGPGDLTLIAPDVPHRWTSSSGAGGRSRACVVGFDQRVVDLAHAMPDGYPPRELLISAVDGAVVRAARADDPERFSVVGLGDLFSLLERLSFSPWTRVTDGPVISMRPRDQERIDRVFTLVSTNLAEGTSIESAARAAHLSPGSFSRFFRRATGRKFQEFVIDIRLGAARSMLLETDIPIARIALEAGFANLSNFNRRFLERHGVTPTQYRRAMSVVEPGLDAHPARGQALG